MPSSEIDFPVTSMGNTTKEALELEVGMEFDSEDRAFELLNLKRIIIICVQVFQKLTC